jgi:hypothetical protein
MEYLTNMIQVLLNSNVTLEIVAILAAFTYVKYFRATIAEKAEADDATYYKWLPILTPYAIDAIKWVEAKIPDGTIGAAGKADMAMKVILNVVAKTHKPEELPNNLGNLVRQVITSVHHDLDRADKLPFPPASLDQSEADLSQDKVEPDVVGLS